MWEAVLTASGGRHVARLWVTSVQLAAVHVLCGPLAEGPEVGGTMSAIRSYCNNKNCKLVFQILDKMILPLGIRIKYTE